MGVLGLQCTGGEPRTVARRALASALPRSRRPRSRRCSSGAPSRLPGPPQPLPCSRVGCERWRGSGTAARAAPTLPPESGVEHSASPRGANEEDVAATAPPTSERGTAGTPASRHARPGAQRGGRSSGSRRARLLHAPPLPAVGLDALGRGQQGRRCQGCGCLRGTINRYFGDFEEESRPAALVGDFQEVVPAVSHRGDRVHCKCEENVAPGFGKKNKWKMELERKKRRGCRSRRDIF